MPVDSDPPPLPTFDARLYEPPAWATDPLHAKGTPKAAAAVDGVDSSDGEYSDDDATPEPSAEDLGVEETDSTIRFTIDELKKLLAQAEALKAEGNKHFTAKPQEIEDARCCYMDALKRLPVCPAPTSAPSEAPTGAKIVEIEDEDRDELHISIRECTKAVWGNLGAVYVVMGDHKETVEACTKALEFDSKYIKALQRRASANESIGSWSSLTAAQEDYTRLVSLLPKTSPQLPAAQRALASLPKRIAVQQEKEKDEMLDKLKELGNGLLGKFGLSTDMFKFDQQPGGGYNMRFQQ